VGSHTEVATANVRCTLAPAEARLALREVLASGPDLVGLQEWSPRRWSLLRETGRLGMVPHVGAAPGAAGSRGSGYLWSAPLLGGCVVGARAERYELLRCRARLLSRPGRADRGRQPLGLEPGRLATAAVYRDRRSGRTVALVAYHLVSGVQVAGAYRPDRPRLVDRHRREVDRLEGLVGELLEEGHVVHAVGDSNVDGFRLPGLTSAWEGRPDAPGTLGPRRHVDDVHGPGPAAWVVPVRTPSDHAALLVRRPDQGPDGGGVG
jgi:hypothetical protein